MPRLAIFLAVCNVLAAGGFIYLAINDYEMRQRWSYEVFRHELVLDGLPVDDKDVGPFVDDPSDPRSRRTRRVDFAIYPDVAQAAYELFEAAGAGESVRTQDEELKRLKDQTRDKLDKLNAAKRRETLKELYLAQARTVEERDAIVRQFANAKNTTDKLMEEFLARFDHLTTDEGASDAEKSQSYARRRAEIAHLLYNLDRSLLAHQRLMVVIGLTEYVHEAEAQALVLRETAHRMQLLTVDDREQFERSYNQQRDRALYLAYELSRKKRELADVNMRIANTKDQIEGNAEKKIDGRKNQIKELEALIAKTYEETEAALKLQSELEKDLFKLNKETGNLIDDNRKLERQISNLELGRTRGGRP
jgi:hypothetical protein